MLESIWSFFRRHRKKFLFLGLTASAGFLSYQWLRRKLVELTETEAQEALDMAKRRHHYDSNQRTCNITLLSLMPSLKESLEKLADTDRLIDDIKSAKQEERLALWEDLKILSVARALTTCYGLSALALVLRVQMNVLGGYMYCDSLVVGQREWDKHVFEVQINADVQSAYLGHIHKFFERDLPLFFQDIKMAVLAELGSMSLKQLLTMTDITALIARVRKQIETRPTLQDETSTAYRIADCVRFDETSTESTSSRDQMLTAQMMRETADLVKSEDFSTVLAACVNSRCGSLLDYVAKRYQSEIEQHPQGNGVCQQSLNTTPIALAKLLVTFSGFHRTVCVSAPNPHIQELMLLEEVKKYSANIYEAFSQPKAAYD